MSFIDIARAMGYRDPERAGKNAVRNIYLTGMSKLRTRPHAMAKLYAMAQALQQARTLRQAGSGSSNGLEVTQ